MNALFRVAVLVGLVFERFRLAFGGLADGVGVVLGGVGFRLVRFLGGVECVLAFLAETVSRGFGRVGSVLTFLANLIGFLFQRLGLSFERLLTGVFPFGIARTKRESAGGSGEKGGNG